MCPWYHYQCPKCGGTWQELDSDGGCFDLDFCRRQQARTLAAKIITLKDHDSPSKCINSNTMADEKNSTGEKADDKKKEKRSETAKAEEMSEKSGEPKNVDETKKDAETKDGPPPMLVEQCSIL